MITTQVEVTTECNFKCWYCAGRSYKPKHMDFSKFLEIMSKRPAGRLWLQGEGEPGLWPHLALAVDWAAAKGFELCAITNGTQLDKAPFQKFNYVGVSLDSDDPQTNAKSGRQSTTEVKKNILAFQKVFKGQLAVHAVDHGQDLTSLRKWCSKHHLTLNVQPLQKKVDYIKLYPKNHAVEPQATVHCQVFESHDRYYNVDGLELPCCYIKDVHDFDYFEMRQKFQARQAPKQCTGCSKLTVSA